MVLVRSTEAYTAIEIKPEATWGVDPGTWGTGAYRVPFLSEDLHFEVETFPDSQEFGALGGVYDIDQGRRMVRGTLRVEPAYDTIWWWLLFSQAWGAENLVTDKDVYENSVTGCNTHIFSPGSGLATGLAMRIWKSGPSDAGFIDTITGLLVTKFTFTHPEGGRVYAEFEFIGKSIVTAAASGLTPVALETGQKRFKARDLSRVFSYFHTGATLTELNVTGWSWTIDRKIEAGGAFLNDPTNLDKPGIVGNREVSFTLNSELEQDYSNTNKPWKEFLDAATTMPTTSLVVIYASSDNCILSTPYGARFDFPLLVWTDVRNNITRGGTQPFTASGRAIVGSIANLDSVNDHNTIPSSGSVDVRVLCNVNQSDEPTTDSKFSSLPNG